MDKTDDASAASAWIDLIVEGSVNIHECENPKMRSFTNHRSFKAETMREWIINLARNTEDELKQELHAAKKISILIDGWTTALPSTHYVAIFAGYCCPKNDEYKEALLSFKPGTIDDHLLHFDNAIARYDLKVGENIFAIVGKSFDSNMKIADERNLPIYVCATEKFDRAAQAWLKESEVNEEWISEHFDDERKELCKKDGPFAELVKIMCRGSELVEDPLLKQQLSWERGFHKNRNNEWHWTTILDMFDKYDKFDFRDRDALNAHLEEKNQELTILSSKYVTGWIHVRLREFETILRSLKRMGVGLKEAKEIFDLVLADDEFVKHGCMKKWLYAEAPFESDVFESACLKIIDGRFYTMTKYEKLLAKHLLIGNDEPPDIWPGEQLYLVLSKKRKIDFRDLWDEKRCSDDSIVYHNPDKRISCTSTCCERLFYKWGIVEFPYTRFVSPILLESMIFLKSNRSLWTNSSVSKAMERKISNLDKKADNNWYYNRESGGCAERYCWDGDREGDFKDN